MGLALKGLRLKLFLTNLETVNCRLTSMRFQRLLTPIPDSFCYIIKFIRTTQKAYVGSNEAAKVLLSVKKE